MRMEFEELYSQTKEQKYDCLLFDLDDTLYPLSSGLAAHCKKNIRDYMSEKLGIERSKVSEMAQLLYHSYGTTMAGLRAIRYVFNNDEYHSFVHGRLPYDKLKPDPVLKHLLKSIPIRKIVFTNADKVHAAKVLNQLGLDDCFDGVICFETLNQPDQEKLSTHKVSTTKLTDIDNIISWSSIMDSGVDLPPTPILCKPSESAMKRALEIANVNPQRTIFFDDSIRNIQAGKRIGLNTVLVGTSQRVKGADYALETLHNVREAVPELWEEGEKPIEIRHGGEVAIGTAVSA
ncbi:hypothetical protein HPP92_012597 [Vanilla planifolia]|uniref:Uncharacterized protein n=1 Tax=Vanilla planifolia TaxID=51239 RepID=A0A835R3Z6_VANPL|nr:hypothetical protein HPP92_012597 [Vanilla planifolia]